MDVVRDSVQRKGKRTGRKQWNVPPTQEVLWYVRKYSACKQRHQRSILPKIVESIYHHIIIITGL